MKKKFLPTLLAGALAVSTVALPQAMPLSFFTQAEDATSQVWDYTADEYSDGVIISGYHGSDEELTIPAEIDGYQVVGIGSGAIRSGSIKKVIISNGIKFLKVNAFENCYHLETIEIPASVEVIDKLESVDTI